MDRVIRWCLYTLLGYWPIIFVCAIVDAWANSDPRLAIVGAVSIAVLYVTSFIMFWVLMLLMFLVGVFGGPPP